MATSNNNEITVKIKCSFEELEMMLKRQCFKELNKYSTTDIFLIPNEIDIEKENSREILKRAILLREFNGITTKFVLSEKKDLRLLILSSQESISPFNPPKASEVTPISIHLPISKAVDNNFLWPS